MLNLVEQIAGWGVDGPLDTAALTQRLTRRAAQYDKSGDAHYNLISALHKSVRGSDPDAALYWLARMLHGGEDPRYLARRITRMAIEDIGLADPPAHRLCLDAWATYERLRQPGGRARAGRGGGLPRAAPKSNAVYTAFGAAMAAARDTGSEPPPKHILNAPTRLMKAEGYGKGYEYDHDAEAAFSGQDYFPRRHAARASTTPRAAAASRRELRERLLSFAAARARKGEPD